MRQRQQGITAIGFVVIAALVALVGYGVIRLIPVYMTQMQVRQMLADVKSEYDGDKPSPAQLRSAIDKRLNIDAVTFPTTSDFAITKTDAGYLVAVAYEDSVPYIGNLSLVASFDNSVEIRQ
ncbi:MAG: DUF4845 domain-containing protein [Gammaproteobacteria bacterium]